MTRHTCPHCGYEVALSNLARHENSCYARPGVRDAVRAAMEISEQPGMAISLDAYRIVAPARGLPSYDALRQQLGGWEQICAWVELEPGRRHGYAPGTRQRTVSSEARAIAETDAEREAVQRVLEQERSAARGLPVCRVRSLPDGRVAYMIR